jgi:hypothetical protein
MRFNHFLGTILGIGITGQGSTNAVEGTHVAVLRHLVANCARRVSLRLGALRLASWRAFKRLPATAMTPAMAMCPSYLDSRQTRQQRVGVVATRGTVGVC